MRHRLLPFTAFAAVLTLAAASARGADVRGYELSVLVDGCAAPEYEHGGRIYLEALRGRHFVLRLSNPTHERIAVALSVDGRNVVDAKRTTALEATKWILAPGQSIEIPGWQVSGETARKFFFTETGRSYARWLGDTSNAGLIEAVFFREKRRWPMPEIGSAHEGIPGGATPGPVEEGPASAPPSARAQAAPRDSAAKRRESDDYAATGIGDRTEFPVRWVDFDEDPAPVARIALRYEFRRELVRLGVLPRAHDALAARERSRGFEPRYAPDPGDRR